MARKRIPLKHEEDDDGDPFVVGGGHIKERTPDEPTVERRDRAERSGGQERPPERDRGRSREDIEEEAMRRMVEKLREKGRSEEFIERNRDAIRERVREELFGHERR